MVYLSELANKNLTQYLTSRGERLSFMQPVPSVDPAISRHADITICRLGGGIHAALYFGDTSLLGEKYPKDCLYNAVVAGKYLICREKSISQSLKSAALKEIGQDAVVIDVAQGYTKCNIAVIDDNHIITEDEGIYKKICKISDIKCLKIRPGFVSLPGYKYGFFGGCCGRVKDEILFNGDVSLHPDYKIIESFIDSCGLGLKYFKGELTDIGSIISD